MAGACTAAGGGPGHHRGDRLGMPAATLLGPAALRLEHGNDPAQALTLAGRPVVSNAKPTIRKPTIS